MPTAQRKNMDKRTRNFLTDNTQVKSLSSLHRIEGDSAVVNLYSQRSGSLLCRHIIHVLCWSKEPQWKTQ